MKETVIEFGPGRRLVGVLTHPAGAVREVTVAITNSGIIHHVGANRLHVRLARHFAAHGYRCLRYDLPGIGDSESIGGGSEQKANLDATCAAFDALQEAGNGDRFVMLGLCSGADHSFQVSCTDPRVAGAVLIDPTALFSTPRHRLNMMLKSTRRALRPRTLWRLAGGRYEVRRRLLQRSSVPRQPGTPRGLGGGDAEVRAQVAAALRALVARNVQVLMVMTGHTGDVYSYRQQMFDAFPDVVGLAEVMGIERRPSAAHTFRDEADRHFLETRILDWLEKWARPARGLHAGHAGREVVSSGVEPQ